MFSRVTKEKGQINQELKLMEVYHGRKNLGRVG
jgi:hypothetical protein